MLERMVNDYLMDDGNEIRLMPCLDWLRSKGIIPDSQQIETIADYINSIRNELAVIRTMQYGWNTKKADRYRNEFGLVGLF